MSATVVDPKHLIYLGDLMMSLEMEIARGKKNNFTLVYYNGIEGGIIDGIAWIYE